MIGDWKVLSFVAYRAQMLYKTVSLSTLRLTDVKGTMLGACLFAGYVEQSLFRCYTGTIPYLFLRYIDDCISAASCPHKELEQFINFTNTFHPNFKFTWTI
eukprot:g27049.t1